jgi:hypothetical protein
MNKDESIAAVVEIESLIKGFGSPDEQARGRVKSLVSSLRYSGPNENYFAEKLGELEVWTEIGFSTRKFAKYGGAEKVRSSALAACMTLKSLIRRWPAHGYL